MAIPNYRLCMDYRRDLLARLNVPFSTARQLVDYVAYGEDPTPFFRSVLENDLKNAVLNADATEAKLLSDLVLFIITYLPTCVRDDVDDWIHHDGLKHDPDGDHLIALSYKTLNRG